MEKCYLINLHKPKKDLFGFVLYRYLHGDKTPYCIVREDGYCDFPFDPKGYFQNKFLDVEKQGLKYVKGKILDVGCGAGRHTLYFAKKGFDVVAIDSDKFCVKTCKERGIKKVFAENILKPKTIKKYRFDTIWFGGNNLGVAGNLEKMKEMFGILDKITNPNSVVLGRAFEFDKTMRGIHRKYHALQKSRGIFPGITKIRIQYKDFIGEWFNWVHISSAVLKKVLQGTHWKIDKLISKPDHKKERLDYFFVIRKI